MRPEIPRSLVPGTDKPDVFDKLMRMMVSENFDLRGMEPKQDVLIHTPLCTGWMIYLNKALTLAHLMHQLDASTGDYVRMKIPHRLRGKSINEIKRYFYYRMKGRYVI